MLAAASAKEATWASGQLGEQRARARFERMLDDDWVALAGYVNRGGETDLLLVGPSAIVAVEVKYLNGVVHCRGLQWTRDKYDRHGNLVGRELPVQDQNGRAPSQQINETAAALEGFLASRGQRVTMRRVVILAHDASRLGEVSDPGVDFVGALVDADFEARLRALLFGSEDRPGQRLDVQALVALIERDHAYHARRRAGRETEAGASSQSPPAPVVAADPAPLPERVVMPFGTDDLEMPPLIRRQLHALLCDVRALHASKGADRACDARVRLAVAGHLLSGARWTVLSAAEGMLAAIGERALLRRMMASCSQSFDLEDRTLCALVVPVAVRLQSRRLAGNGIAEGASDMLTLPALLLPKLIGARRVAFSARIYAGQDLLDAEARTLRELLLRIEAGDDLPATDLKPCWVRAAAEPEWQLVYFLGVAVMEPGASLSIDTEDAQRDLMNLRQRFADAFVGMRNVAFNRELKAQAVCEGIWTLEAGVRQGEQLRRRHQLERFLGTLEVVPRDVALSYAHDPQACCARLLVCSAGRAREFRWMLLPGEELEGFEDALRRAVPQRMGLRDAGRIRRLDRLDYEACLRDAGLGWIGNA